MDPDKIEEWMTNTRWKRIMVAIGIITVLPMILCIMIFGTLFLGSILFDFIRGGDHWEGKWVPESCSQKKDKVS